MNRIRSSWRRSKLKTKLLWTYCILILISMTSLTIFTFSVFSSSLRNKILYSARHSISQTVDFLDYKFFQVIGGLSQVANDTVIREKLSSEIKSDIKTEYWNLLDMKERLIEYQNSERIQRVRLYVDDELIAAKDRINIFGMENAGRENWMQQIKEKDIEIYSFSNEALGGNTKNQSLAFAEKVKSISDYNKVVGYVRVDISKDEIEKILLKADATTDSITYLIDEKNQVVASSKKGDYVIPKIDPEEVKKDYLVGEDSFREIKVGMNRYLISEHYLYNSSWYMVTVIPYSGMMQEVNVSQIGFVITALIILLLVGILITLIANSVTKRVERLLASMQMVQQGRLNICAGDGGEDEIGSLYENFDFMIQKTQRLLDEKYELGKQAKSAELKALQSQINPHFLYNTLDMIKWFSYSGKNEEIDKVVTELVRFYKMTLNRGKEIVTLQEEITHSQAYVAIQNYRFDGAVYLINEIPEAITTCLIPKITLQPLIENSILHGILEKEEEKGTIRLTGKVKGDEIILYLQDDGVGIEPEILKGIFEDKKGHEPENSFGVRNIHERLKIRYGEKAGLVYHSKVDQGTTVEIHFSSNV